MRTQEIESWALKIVDIVTSGKKVEDSRVELKSDWPTDTNKIARRIAGLANPAAGEPVIMIIGLSEETGVTGIANEKDLASWWPQVIKEFESEYPSLKDVRMEVSGHQIAVLYFETDMAPYVVKNSSFGNSPTAVSLEVPWREGTSVRSARRADLIRILTPKIKQPHAEITNARMQASIAEYGGKNSLRVGYNISFSIYLTPADQTPISFPFHKIEAHLDFDSGAIAPLIIRNITADKNSSDVQQTSSGITFRGPGSCSAFVYARPYADESFISKKVRLVFTLFSPTLSFPVTVTKDFESKLTLEMLSEKLGGERDPAIADDFANPPPIY